MDGKAKLGQMLVEANLITEDQLRMALEFQQSVGGRLGAIIVKLGFVEEETLMNFISRQMDVPLLDLDEIVIPENLVKKLPRKLIEKHCILPVGFRNGVLSIVTADPYDFEALEELQLAVDYKIEVNLAPRGAIVKVIRSIFDIESMEPVASSERSKEDILKELEEEGAPRPEDREPTALEMRHALIPLLIGKGIITEEELQRKAREMRQ